MAAIVRAVIRGIGKWYADGTEAIEIHVPSDRADGLPYRVGDRVHVSLRIADGRYEAGLRSTARNPYVWICPDVISSDGKRTKLAHLVAAAGWKKNDRVLLKAYGTDITVQPTSFA